MLYRVDRSGEKPKLVAIDPMELSYDPARHRVIIFPGGDAYHFKALGMHNARDKVLGGLIKTFSETIAPLDANSTPPVDVYAYTVDDAWLEIAGSYRRHYRNDPRPPKQFADGCKQLLHALLLEKGQRFEDIDLIEMKKRISHLTFPTFSVGSVTAVDAANCLAQELQKAGWNDKAVADAVKELVVVSVGSVARLDSPGPHATRFVFTGSNDPILESGLAHIMNAAGRKTRFASGYDTCKLDAGKIKTTQLDVGYQVQGRLREDEVLRDRKQADGSVKPESITSVGIPFLGLTLQHNFWNFYNGNKEMGRTIRNVMLNAVTREPGIGDGHQLFEQHALNTSHVVERAQSEAAR